MRQRRAGWYGLLAVSAGLLVAVPALLAIANVQDWRALAAAAAISPVAALFAWVGRDRLTALAQHRDEQAKQLASGTFTPGGRLPRVREITDPIAVGVHPAPLRDPTEDGDPLSRDRVPVYVPRDIDLRLRDVLNHSGFLLLVGDSTAGKTRTAYEAMRATLPDHVFIAPEGRDGLSAAIEAAAKMRRCVLWLNDMEHYLGSEGLTRMAITELLAGNNHHRIILATLRAAEESRLTGAETAPGEEGRQLQYDTQAVLDQADRIFLERNFTGTERGRAREMAEEDPRISDALVHSGSYGLAEYLACGPELLREWENAWARGTHPRGASLIEAAIDCCRAGYTSPLPRALLSDLHVGYLSERGGARLRPEPEDRAWEWATRLRPSGNALLHPVGNDTFEVFDYLIDVVQRRTPAGQYVPERTLITALAYASPADSLSIAGAAYSQGRYQLAEHALRQATEHDRHRPDHPDALARRSNLAALLRRLGRLDEAEREARAVLNSRIQVLGPEHPHTLASRSILVTILRDLARFEEAEEEGRRVLSSRIRVLGDLHRSSLASRCILATVLGELGRLEEAKQEAQAALNGRILVLGPEHPYTLASRSNLAIIMSGLGQIEEAEREGRAALNGRIQILGPEHPDTLASRSVHSVVLYRLGRLEEAEEAGRTVLDGRTRVLGVHHPDTLASQAQLDLILDAQRRPAP
ncbi:tetratricopeptide repeat protein [Actinomadura soli]|uniref:Tetratricopeptide repeat protein n=1 Tax=Actinomadura soli TaxID=2508997 RepID=A0A5C4JJ16_9ACTN|nr:tetratricopeptide repeat protein [Actinomadura soli]TMR07015.1 tetratricopeptide repeat protein [Actinomadura soli]